MSANSEQAEVCATKGAEAFRKGNLDEALKFLDKSLRMHELPGVRAMRDRVAQRKADAAAAEAAEAEEGENVGGAAATPSSARSSGASSAQGTSEPSAHAGSASRAPASAAGASARRQGAASGGGGSSSAQRAAPSSSSASSAPPQRPYTPEQVELVQRIKKAKNYYEVLSVAQDADEDACKKAYRSLALKLHPDKNSAPGAEDAFKRVGAAYATLSDAEKRSAYDRYGDEGDNSGNNGESRARRYQQYEESHMHRGHGGMDEDDFDPFNIWAQMFGGVPINAVYMGSDGTYRRVQTRQRRAPQHHAQHAHQQGGPQNEQAQYNARVMQLFQLLPLIVLVIFTLLSMGSHSGFGDSETRLFTLSEDGPFRVERRTSSMNHVTGGLPYYVREDFRNRVAADRYFLGRVEKAVEQEMYTSLTRKCAEEKQKLRALQNKVAYSEGMKRVRLQEALDAYTMPSCTAYEKYFPS